MNPQISIIMPCYRAERFIHKAVDSILAQTFRDFELILVDDGSPDSTGIICDEYASHDKRIRVIHKLNGGVSTARQAGFDMSKGEFVIHADPDDFVEIQWLDLLYNKAVKTDADITICDYNEITDTESKVVRVYPSTDGKECMKMQLQWQLSAQLWNKLIRKALYLEHGIRITSGLDLREDSSIMYRIYFFANKVAHVNVPLYNYNLDNKASLAHNIMTEAHQEDLYLLMREEQEFCRKHITDSEMTKAFKVDFITTVGYMSMMGGHKQFCKNKDLVKFITIRDVSLCNGVYKPLFVLSSYNLYCLIPIYWSLFNLFHNLKNK